MRSILIITYVLVCLLFLGTAAYGIIKHIGAAPEATLPIIMILLIGPGLAVIAGIGRKMKKW